MISIESLSEAGFHYGYSKTRRHPSAKPYIAGNKNGSDIIDIQKSVIQMEEAVAFLLSIKNAGRQILFVGVKPEIRQLIKETALSLNQPYVADRFIGGSLTNFHQMKKRVDKLHDLLKKKESGELAVYTKKEQLLIQRDIERLDRDFGGVSFMANLPAAIVIVDPRHEDMCVREATQLAIPVVALSNTDCNIKDITYPVVGNDGALSSVTLFLNTIKESLHTQA